MRSMRRSRQTTIYAGRRAQLAVHADAHAGEGSADAGETLTSAHTVRSLTLRCAFSGWNHGTARRRSRAMPRREAPAHALPPDFEGLIDLLVALAVQRFGTEWPQIVNAIKTTLTPERGLVDTLPSFPSAARCEDRWRVITAHITGDKMAELPGVIEDLTTKRLATLATAHEVTSREVAELRKVLQMQGQAAAEAAEAAAAAVAVSEASARAAPSAAAAPSPTLPPPPAPAPAAAPAAAEGTSPVPARLGLGLGLG